jgi:hypothetical protein
MRSCSRRTERPRLSATRSAYNAASSPSRKSRRARWHQPPDAARRDASPTAQETGQRERKKDEHACADRERALADGLPASHSSWDQRCRGGGRGQVVRAQPAVDATAAGIGSEPRRLPEDVIGPRQPTPGPAEGVDLRTPQPYRYRMTVEPAPADRAPLVEATDFNLRVGQ